MKRKISVEDLRPGMRVAKMKSELWLSHPTVYAKSGLLATWEEIQVIRESGYTFTYVEVDRASSLTVRGEVPLTDEILQARAIYAEATGVAHHLFVRAAEGKRLDVEPSRRAVESITDSVSRNPDAMHCLARLTPIEGHLATHSVNVAVICIAFGLFLELPHEDVMELGLAGMLHDIGKAKVPSRILEKPGKLSESEFRAMKAHSMHGLSIMHGRPGTGKRIQQAVIEHHERFDGTGYPFGLGGTSITPFARYIALADTFDAMTSKRTYKESMLPSKTLALMYQERGRQFAPVDVDLFVKCLGVYPTGSLVKLTDGRTAVVYETNPACPLSPIVNVFMDAALEPVEPHLENLAEISSPDAGAPVEIASALNPSDAGMNLSRLLFY